VKIPAPLANAIIVLVSLVWAGNFLASVFLPGYEPDATINFVFMTIVGGALALRGGEGGGVSGLISRVIRPAEPPPPPPPSEPGDRP
jgi:hypothetical protein